MSYIYFTGIYSSLKSTHISLWSTRFSRRSKRISLWSTYISLRSKRISLQSMYISWRSFYISLQSRLHTILYISLKATTISLISTYTVVHYETHLNKYNTFLIHYINLVACCEALKKQATSWGIHAAWWLTASLPLHASPSICPRCTVIKSKCFSSIIRLVQCLSIIASVSSLPSALCTYI